MLLTLIKLNCIKNTHLISTYLLKIMYAIIDEKNQDVCKFFPSICIPETQTLKCVKNSREIISEGKKNFCNTYF